MLLAQFTRQGGKCLTHQGWLAVVEQLLLVDKTHIHRAQAGVEPLLKRQQGLIVLRQARCHRTVLRGCLAIERHRLVTAGGEGGVFGDL